MVKASYIARKQFKYGGQVIYPGQPWKPNGGKFDDKIIRCNFVRQVLEEVPEPAAQEIEVELSAKPESEVTNDQIESGRVDEYSGDNRQRSERGGGNRRTRVHSADGSRRPVVDGG